MRTKLTLMMLALVSIFAVVACSTPADKVSSNLSSLADEFKIARRVVFYNGITDTYMLSIEGYCSLGNRDSASQRTITCKVGTDQYKKHFLGLSDNVTYFVEQIDGANASPNHYRVFFRPHTILPDFVVSPDLSGDPGPGTVE